MECYKLIIEVNGKMRYYVFSAENEEHRQEKLKAWKSENITPYDRVVIYFNGTLEEHEKTLPFLLR